MKDIKQAIALCKEKIREDRFRSHDEISVVMMDGPFAKAFRQIKDLLEALDGVEVGEIDKPPRLGSDAITYNLDKWGHFETWVPASNYDDLLAKVKALTLEVAELKASRNQASMPLPGTKEGQ